MNSGTPDSTENPSRGRRGPRSSPTIMTSVAAAGSPSSSSSAVTITTVSSSADPRNPNLNPNNSSSSMQSWWESISKARSRIAALAGLLPSLPHLASLADSDRPARSLLSSPDAYAALSGALLLPSAGAGDDPLCHWLYDTFLSADPDLRLVVLSLLPSLAAAYLPRALLPDPPSLAGFEAVLLALYGAEALSRSGKPLLVSIPDLSQPSLYHAPRAPGPPARPSVAVLSPPLEPHRVVKSTKRACILAVALDSYYKTISLMPSRSKADLCRSVASWAGQDCPCRYLLDHDPNPNPNCFEITTFSSNQALSETVIKETFINGHQDPEPENGDSRVPLPWELLQPVLRILGHCLLAPLNPQEVRDAASVAVRSVYARASHDLLPQAILASRSLIQLDKAARMAAKDAAPASNPNTPSKPKKPEVFLVSK